MYDAGAFTLTMELLGQREALLEGNRNDES